MFWWNVFVQGLGLIGILFMTISVQFNTHGKIMLFKTLGTLMFVIQYFFLGAYTGMVLDFIGIIRNVIFAKNVKKQRNNTPWIIGFAFFTIIVGILTIVLTWNELIGKMATKTDNYTLMVILAVTLSIFSIIAKTLTTIGYGLKDPHKLRCLNFPSSALWFIYNSVYFSLSGVINEIFVMSSILVAEIRFKKKNKHKSIQNKNVISMEEQKES